MCKQAELRRVVFRIARQSARPAIAKQICCRLLVTDQARVSEQFGLANTQPYILPFHE